MGSFASSRIPHPSVKLELLELTLLIPLEPSLCTSSKVTNLYPFRTLDSDEEFLPRVRNNDNALSFVSICKVKEISQFGQGKTKPQSRHITNEEYPRRFSNSTLCSPLAKRSRSFSSSFSEKEEFNRRCISSRISNNFDGW